MCQTRGSTGLRIVARRWNAPGDHAALFREDATRRRNRQVGSTGTIMELKTLCFVALRRYSNSQRLRRPVD